MPVLQPGEALFERHAHQRDMFDKPRRQHRIEHRVANARGERIAAKCRAMRANGHPRAASRDVRSAKRKSAADALGDCHDVRRDTKSS